MFTITAMPAEDPRQTALASALNLIQEGKQDEAYDTISTLADEGYAAAQTYYGVFLIQGVFNFQEVEEGFAYLQKAADQGDLRAMIQTGNLYLSRIPNFAPNKKKATDWFKKAAETGNPEAQMYLAEMFLSRKLGTGQESRAIAYVVKAADQNHYPALKQLFSIYGYGITEIWYLGDQPQYKYGHGKDHGKMIDAGNRIMNHEVRRPEDFLMIARAYARQDKSAQVAQEGIAILEFLINNGHMPAIQELADIFTTGTTFIPVHEGNMLDAYEYGVSKGDLYSIGNLYRLSLLRKDSVKAAAMRSAYLKASASSADQGRLLNYAIESGDWSAVSLEIKSIVENFQQQGILEIGSVILSVKNLNIRKRLLPLYQSYDPGESKTQFGNTFNFLLNNLNQRMKQESKICSDESRSIQRSELCQ